mgnify:FL=1
MMDAVEFLEQLKKRSKSNPDYYGEELNIAHIEPISLVSQVEQWAAEHPVKTRQSVFLEQYPETEIDKYGCLRLCPELVSADYRNRHGDCINRVCIDCHREFWLAEVEE